jgi:hypothetical protein
MSKFLIILFFSATWANVCVCGTRGLHKSQTIWRHRDPLLKFRSGVWHLSDLSEMSSGLHGMHEVSRNKLKKEEEEEEAERKRVYERYRMSSNDGSSFLRDFHTYRF